MAEFSELRVIGSPQGFAVYDGTRRKLNVMALDLFIRPGNPPLMQVAMPAGNIDVIGKALFAIVDLTTGKPRVVKRIEWADGQATDFPEPEKAESVVNKKQTARLLPAPSSRMNWARPMDKLSLYLDGKDTGISVQRDRVYGQMWRIHQSDWTSDMVNLSRAKDAARIMAGETLEHPVAYKATRIG